MRIRHSVEVAKDITNILRFTPYVYRIRMGTGGTYVEVADAKKMASVTVRIDNHRKEDNNLLQDKYLAVKLAARLIYNLRKI